MSRKKTDYGLAKENENATQPEDGPENSRNMELRKLDDTLFFPTFKELPRDNEIPLHYFDETADSVFSPFRHWCLLADVEFLVPNPPIFPFQRLRFVCRDRVNHQFPIHVHTPTMGVSSTDEHFLKKLNEDKKKFPCSVAILWAENHFFKDFTQGIRLESASFLKVFPSKTEDLIAEVERYLPKNAGKCFVCLKSGPSVDLKRCAKCKLARYCGVECQRNHWLNGHKKLCEQAETISGIAEFDFDQFDHWSEMILPNTWVGSFHSIDHFTKWDEIKTSV